MAQISLLQTAEQQGSGYKTSSLLGNLDQMFNDLYNASPYSGVTRYEFDTLSTYTYNNINAGSQAKGFTIATTLAGLTNNLVIQHSSVFPALVAAQGSTATPIIGPIGYEEFDGTLIVPPGGIFCLINTTSNTTVSVASTLCWEEVPV